MNLATSIGDDGGPLGTTGSPSHEARVKRFQEELRMNSISMTNLQKLAYHGIPDREGLRPVVWKVGRDALSYAGRCQEHAPLAYTVI